MDEIILTQEEASIAMASTLIANHDEEVSTETMEKVLKALNRIKGQVVVFDMLMRGDFFIGGIKDDELQLVRPEADQDLDKWKATLKEMAACKPTST